jgi:hypothetical protein
MRDEVLGPLEHPGQVADAQLAALGQGGSEHQARGVGQRLDLAGEAIGGRGIGRRARRASAFPRSRQSRSQRSSATTSS